MTDEQAYQWLVENRGAIAANLCLQALEAQSAEWLATRVIIMTDSPDVRAMIEMAARHLIALEVERRR